MDISTALLVRNPQVSSRPMGDDCILLHLETGYYYTLNPVGRFLWELLEAPRSLAELVDRVIADYAVDEPTAAADVREILSDLAREDLVVAHE